MLKFSSYTGKKILEVSCSAFLLSVMAFLLASRRPPSTKILFLKSFTCLSTLKWIFELSFSGAAEGEALETEVVELSVELTDEKVVVLV